MIIPEIQWTRRNITKIQPLNSVLNKIIQVNLPSQKFSPKHQLHHHHHHQHKDPCLLLEHQFKLWMSSAHTRKYPQNKKIHFHLIFAGIFPTDSTEAEVFRHFTEVWRPAKWQRRPPIQSHLKIVSTVGWWVARPTWVYTGQLRRTRVYIEDMCLTLGVIWRLDITRGNNLHLWLM